MIRWLERVMFAAGALCLGWVLFAWQEAAAFQAYGRAELQRLIDQTGAPQTGMPRQPAPLRGDRTLIGLLSIPRLSLSVVAVEGDDGRALRVAAGHLRDTPLPWQGGNTAFAGHRDRFFHALNELRAGDAITLATVHGTFAYRVTRTVIVNPGDLSILQPHDGTSLTLITCYPFSYLGAAPQRFVVQAARDDEEARENPHLSE